MKTKLARPAIALFAAALLFAGCSTPYRAFQDDRNGGYRESRLAADRWQVSYALPAYEGPAQPSYRGPDGADYRRLKNLALRRAAELCSAPASSARTSRSRSRPRARASAARRRSSDRGRWMCLCRGP